MIKEGEGTSARVLLDDRLRRRLIDTLRADLQLGSEAAADFGSVRVDVQVLVLGGRSDSLIPHELLPSWAAHTSAECRVELLPGGHFALLARENRDAVATALATVLQPFS